MTKFHSTETQSIKIKFELYEPMTFDSPEEAEAFAQNVAEVIMKNVDDCELVSWELSNYDFEHYINPQEPYFVEVLAKVRCYGECDVDLDEFGEAGEIHDEEYQWGWIDDNDFKEREIRQELPFPYFKIIPEEPAFENRIHLDEDE